MKWFINECGDVYEYDQSSQQHDFPNDFPFAYETKEEAESIRYIILNKDNQPLYSFPRGAYMGTWDFTIPGLRHYKGRIIDLDRDTSFAAHCEGYC